jgi:hypothetical protein
MRILIAGAGGLVGMTVVRAATGGHWTRWRRDAGTSSDAWSQRRPTVGTALTCRRWQPRRPACGQATGTSAETKSVTACMTSAGCSECGSWPARSMIRSRAPGIPAASSR